jgi:hypothetical protein
MDARQQDPRASAGTGGRQAAPAPEAAAGASKSIGFAELLAVAAGLGGLYLLVRLRTEASAAEREEFAAQEHEHVAPESRAASVAGWGHTYPHPDNPPAWVRDEHLWERAKHVVRPHWHEYREPWAVVAHVYEQMGGHKN